MISALTGDGVDKLKVSWSVGQLVSWSVGQLVDPITLFLLPVHVHMFFKQCIGVCVCVCVSGSLYVCIKCHPSEFTLIHPIGTNNISISDILRPNIIQTLHYTILHTHTASHIDIQSPPGNKISLTLGVM